MLHNLALMDFEIMLHNLFVSVHMLWFNFIFGLKFSNQFALSFPLFQIMIIMNLRQ